MRTGGSAGTCRGEAEVAHRVRIRLLRITERGVVDPDGLLSCQWESVCVCGWRCLSWSWRDWGRGSLAVSLDHLAETAEQVEGVRDESA